MKNALMLVLILVVLVDIEVQLSRPKQVLAQSGSPIYLHVATSLANCVWPVEAGPVRDGMAICPVNQNGVLGLALAVNGGKFSMLTGAGGVAFTQEACTSFARIGVGMKVTGCIEQ